jgi:pSer/pThr/pTyr-binding forkhead associated (FHA) protein
LRFSATRAATVTVRVGERRRTLRVRACRTYRLRLGATGRVRVAAVAGRHAERRTLG